jgi:RES domain
MAAYDSKEFESRFPSKEVALEFISKLRGLTLKDISLNELDGLIDEAFHMIPFGLGVIPKDKLLYRARVNEKDKQFLHLDQLTLRKHQDVKSFGRANQPGESIFYCSTNMNLACGEVLQDMRYSFQPKYEAGFATVSVWKTIKEIRVAPMYYSDEVTKVRKDIAAYKEGNRKQLKEWNKVSHATLEISDLIMEFFCDEFSKGDINYEDDYKFSVSYTRRLQDANTLIAPEHRKERFDGVVYPSVALKFAGDNVALFDDNLYTKIKFQTAYEVVCTHFDFDIGTLNSFFLHEIESIDGQGNIVWKKAMYGQ